MHILPCLVNKESYFVIFGNIWTWNKNPKQSLKNGENSCGHDHTWTMMPYISKHKIIEKYCLRCNSEKFHKSEKMLKKCRKFSWTRWIPSLPCESTKKLGSDDTHNVLLPKKGNETWYHHCHVKVLKNCFPIGRLKVTIILSQMRHIKSH